MPKYLEVAEILKSRVLHGDYLVSPMPGERKLAEEIGVSYMTARKALKHLVETGVIAREEDGKALPFSPEGLRGGYVFLAPAFVSMLTIRWQTALNRTLSRAGRILRPVYFTHWNDPAVADALSRFDLIFLLPKLEPPSELLLRKLHECGKPVVVLETDWTDRGFFSILPTPVEAVTCLLEHLAERGDPVDCFNTQPLDEIVTGWFRMWEKFPVRGVMVNDPVDFYEDTLERAVRVASRLLQEHWRPKAVLCTTLTAAIGLSRVLCDFEMRVGRDVRLAAVNDVKWAAYLTPSITTLENADLDLLIREALAMLRNDPGQVRCLKPARCLIQYGESSRSGMRA